MVIAIIDQSALKNIGMNLASRMNRMNHKDLLLAMAWLLGSGIASVPGAACIWAKAHDGLHIKPRVVRPAEYYAPTLMPDRIILTWAGDPRTTQAVTWRTSVEVKQAFAEIAEATSGPEFRQHTSMVPATTTYLQSDLNEAHYHSVSFRHLKPGTTYCYRVGDQTNWSEWFQFSTAREEAEPFSFIYFGDAQNEVRSMWSRVIRQAQKNAPQAKFLVHAGDLINKAESDAEWGEWFGAGGWLNAMIPSMPVPGNHEQAKLEDDTRRLTKHWRPQFTLPVDGPPGLEETCYAFEYQNALMVSLNSNEKLPEQAQWLDQLLSLNRKPWVICVFHHPVYSAAKERDNAPLRNAWKPIFDRYRVDLVLQGHDHSYTRSGLQVEMPAAALETDRNVPVGINHVDVETGTIYVVSVSGPKMYAALPQAKMKRVGDDLQLYQIVRIDGETLSFEARTATGQLYDAFLLRKRPGLPNLLEEGTPELPEKRRPVSN